MVVNKNKIPSDIIYPRQLYGHDLKAFIQEKSEAGYQLLVLGNFNSDHSELAKWMNHSSCVDVLQKRHGVCPIIYQRSVKDPIDCCFDDGSLKIKKGG